jgi:hypothetical protein
MVIALGAHCQGCGTEECLTFDCISPRGDTHHRWSAPQRISFYRKQMREGNLQLLCANCNALKADMASEVWRRIVSIVAAEEARLRRTRYPGQGPRWTPSERYDHIQRHIHLLTYAP